MELLKLLLEWFWHVVKNVDVLVAGIVVGAIFAVFFLRIKANASKVNAVVDKGTKVVEQAKDSVEKVVGGGPKTPTPPASPVSP